MSIKTEINGSRRISAIIISSTFLPAKENDHKDENLMPFLYSINLDVISIRLLQ